jgi:hypothetical protein
MFAKFLRFAKPSFYLIYFVDLMGFQDPEFYQFLKEHDKELLDFDDEDAEACQFHPSPEVFLLSDHRKFLESTHSDRGFIVQGVIKWLQSFSLMCEGSYFV